ncbi:MAG: 6-phosphogluconolactonase [Beutenbergiaceae bacterium]
MTTSTTIHEFEDAAALGRALATVIADDIQQRLPQTGRYILGCPGGRTPTSTYAALAQEVAARQLDLSGLIIAMMDDYVRWDGHRWQHIDIEAHNSCRKFAYQQIQAVLNAEIPAEHAIGKDNVWFPDPADPAAYDDRLRAAGGIDFFLLASGAGDGHVAFNPPGSPVTSGTRIVALAEQTRRDNLHTFPQFAGLDEVPTHGVTVGIATISEFSRAAAMILIGANKREAFAHLTAGTTYDPQWPATVYHLVHDAALWVDSGAGRQHQ